MKQISRAVLILCGFFVSAAWAQQPACTHSPFWAEFHKENMERWNLCENVLNVHNVGNLGVKWSYTTINHNFVLSSPAIVNGVVYFGSNDNNVYALDASTGAKLWNYATGETVNSSPAVANGVVYVGSDDANVYALNAKTGAKLWSYAAGDIVESSPTVANGVVYVGSGGNLNAMNLQALNASTGAKLWSVRVGLYGTFDASPAVAKSERRD
jgi:outer membrane protein assembly factor BamB